MGDAGAEGPILRSLRVDVDPLMVPGGVRELVDAILVISSQSL